MRHLPLVVAAVLAAAAVGLLWNLVSQGVAGVARAEAERAELEHRREVLQRSIRELETTLEALRTDPRAVESMARQELGWVRPGEVVVVVATPPPAAPLALTAAAPTPILRLRD